MKPEEVPQNLIDILDRHAGKKHSVSGYVVQALAEILTCYDQALAAEGSYGPYEAPYDEARITVRCTQHRRELEFWAQEDASSILDRVQLSCPGLTPDLHRIHKERDAIVAEASRVVRQAYKDTHPEEVARYPGDWVGPIVSSTHYPDRFKQALHALDLEEGALADACLHSWRVVIEQRK